MQSLKSIKNRIGSIKSTKKITQAMKIVAASRLKRAQDNVAKTKEYLQTFDNLLLSIYNTNKSVFQEGNSPYLQNNNQQNDQQSDQQNILIVVFGSDRGLCGSFNSKLISAIAHKISTSNDKNIKVICVGDKVSNYMNIHYKENVEFNIPFANPYNKSISYPHVASLSQKIQNLFKDKNFSECRILYTRFKSMMHQKVINTKLLPLDMDYIANIEAQSKDKEIFEFDNDLYMTLEQVVLHLISATIFNVYANSVACEYSTRMIAMDSATQNSEKMLKELSLIYNRSRQALITKELIEIISGAEAIN